MPKPLSAHSCTSPSSIRSTGSVRVAQKLRSIPVGSREGLRSRSSCWLRSARAIFRAHSQRATSSFITINVTAPIAPPTNELSGPMIAFWTTFDSRSTTTKSDAVSWAASRFAKRIKM